MGNLLELSRKPLAVGPCKNLRWVQGAIGEARLGPGYKGVHRKRGGANLRPHRRDSRLRFGRLRTKLVAGQNFDTRIARVRLSRVFYKSRSVSALL
jgi:hypothetical protein